MISITSTCRPVMYVVAHIYLLVMTGYCTIRTRTNPVKFSHQSPCNPKISSFMKALKKGFLKGCLNLSKELVTKYLNPSPATAKGRMKHPKKGIHSTRTKPLPTVLQNPQQPAVTSIPQQPIAQANPLIFPLFNDVPPYPGPAYHATLGSNIFTDDESIANIFCFGAFANKITGVIYNDLTGNFPFMSLYGSLCFFVLYHYEINSILAAPITNLDDKSIFTAYKANFEMLEAKRFTPKVNVMDNQATKYIEKILTEKGCQLQLVEPRNHCVNELNKPS